MHTDLLRCEGIDSVEVDDVTAAALKEAVAEQQFAFILIQWLCGCECCAVCKGKMDTFIIGFDKFNILQRNAVDGVAFLDQNPPGALLYFLRQFIQAPVKRFGIQGLEQILACLYRIGIHGKFR